MSSKDKHPRIAQGPIGDDVGHDGLLRADIAQGVPVLSDADETQFRRLFHVANGAPLYDTPLGGDAFARRMIGRVQRYEMMRTIMRNLISLGIGLLSLGAIWSLIQSFSSHPKLVETVSNGQAFEGTVHQVNQALAIASPAISHQSIMLAMPILLLSAVCVGAIVAVRATD